MSTYNAAEAALDDIANMDHAEDCPTWAPSLEGCRCAMAHIPTLRRALAERAALLEALESLVGYQADAEYAACDHGEPVDEIKLHFGAARVCLALITKQGR